MAGRRSGARPSPRSRHFLRTRLATQLVAEACVTCDDLVVDLGAGGGRLTAELAARARHVVAVELDPRLASSLRGRWANVDVVQGDAVTARLPRERFRVVANLPFHRTTDILHRLLDDPTVPLERADVVVEWGVAFRYGVPWPSSLNAVTWGAFYETSIARRLPRTAFEPPPATDAGVLVFRRRASPLIAPEQASAYRTFVAGGFRRGVRNLAPRGTIARELDAHQWAELFASVTRAAGAR